MLRPKCPRRSGVVLAGRPADTGVERATEEADGETAHTHEHHRHDLWLPSCTVGGAVRVLAAVTASVAGVCAAAAFAAPAVAAAPAPTVEHGTLEVTHFDEFGRGLARPAYLLATAGGSVVRLNLSGGAPALPSGTPVAVRGTAAPGSLSVAAPSDIQASGGSGTGARPASAQPAAATTQTLAVVLVNFTDDTRTPFTTDQMRSQVFTDPHSVSAFFAEQSFGRVSFTGRVSANGDVFGWYTVARSPSAGCAFTTWSASADAAAATAGVDLSAYDHVAYIFPQQTSCAFSGVGMMPGREVWINGDISVRVIGHELGHNLGVHHASSLRCLDANGSPVPLALPVSSRCTSSEYGDPFDTMGSGNALHENAWHKAQSGWLAAGAVQTLSSGTTTIAPDEFPVGNEPQLVRVPSVGANSLWLDYRQPFGFDVFSSTDPVVNGVSIRLAPSLTTITQSQLLDMQPASPTLLDAPLMPGQTFVDPASGAHITTVSATPLGATVQVAGAPQAAPDTTAPSVPAGLSAKVAGSPPVLTLSWNQSTDDVGVAGYRVLRNGAFQALVTNGTTYADNTVQAGRSYTYTVSALDAAGNQSAQSAPLVVNVPGKGAGHDTTPPSAPTNLRLSAGPAGADGSRSVTLTWGASHDDVGVIGYHIDRGSTHLPPVSGTTRFVDTVKAGIDPVTYRVRAFDAAGNESASSNVATLLWSAAAWLSRSRAGGRFDLHLSHPLALHFTLQKRAGHGWRRLAGAHATVRGGATRVFIGAGRRPHWRGHFLWLFRTQHLTRARYRVELAQAGSTTVQAVGAPAPYAFTIRGR